ncbi:ABC-F family ATP-binding cassette domain-containing protein [Vallitalea sp.]|jgi:ATP-binding cassette subfamily F protein uup|uniref:ABC-F family ATP-binding cassette domain-containing protein n=1 Tax=Vallitalea sp. TaxID=1882829 RepID=UPI0025FE4799|nr:ABC-F family ATP-binding cassette domain-containing protein [Vallitalea sp.]MCT4688900.1 ABC-F family ATP-binding cassette domain-containing protein [Vallitalea sp.]
MNILSAENLSKSYSEKTLFENITFGIDDNEKIGLIGVNGTGKSTLLKTLVGIESLDEGKVVTGRDVKIQYLSQNPDFDNESTVLEQIFQGDSKEMKLIREYELVVQKLEKEYDNVKLQDRLTELNSDMDSYDAWKMESEAKSILTKLGIRDFESKMGILSGGQRKRVALAAALIQPSDLLILDEPTNHIDDTLIEWLEDYLNNRKGALLMITHDRYFLDRVTNRILELAKGGLYSYVGNYSLYLEKKAEREQEVINKELKRRNIFRNELEWIRRGARARSTKQKARIDRFEQLKEQKVDLRQQNMDITVGTRRLGKKIIDIHNVSKSFGSNNVLKDFDYTVLRDDRVGIIGANGMGKSTLLNMIDSRLTPDNGSIDIGETVVIGYYSQENLEMDESIKVIEYIKEVAEYITAGDNYKITASQMLERFLFTKEMQYTFINRLSGGEKRRLYLLRVLMQNPNVLLLDEPTNDLDVQTLTILEEYIENFKGVVITVSHDRYFLDKICDKLFVFMGNGEVKQFTGNYTNYIKINPNVVGSNEDNEKAINIEKENTKSNYKQRERAPKFSYKEKIEYEEIDGKIEEVEDKISKVEEEIGKGGSDFVRLQELTEEKEKLESKLVELMDRWEYLNELAERIMSSNRL